MKKITCLFAALLAFIGVVNAQETKDPYTLAQGAEVQLSTDGGTQYAYYLRCKEQDNKLFYVEKTTGDNYPYLTTSSEQATKIVLCTESNNKVGFYVINDSEEKVAKFRSKTPIAWVIGKDSKTWSETPADFTYTLTKVDDANGVAYNISCNQQKNLGWGKVNSNPYAIVNNAATSLTWYFIPANDAAKQAAGWPEVNILQGDDVHGNLTTFSSSKAVILPSDYNVYGATLNSTTLELTEKNSEITLDGNLALPSGKGVVIKGQVGSAYAIPFTDSRDLALETILQATNETPVTVSDATHYALGMANEELGFYKVKSGTSIGANKAYLNLTSGGEAIKMVFADNNTTGIHTATSVEANANAPIFDLSGRRVANAVKGGVYIQNGKKFVK